MDLFRAYSSISRNYYSLEVDEFENDFLNSKQRIEDFFRIANKERLSMDFEVLDELRNYHSMSIVYFGILLNEKLNVDMQIIINDFNFNFKYYWSIMCFYHDLGYVFENDSSYIYKIRKKNYESRIRGYNYFFRIANSGICYDGMFFNSYKRNLMLSYNQIFMTNYINRKNTITTESEFDDIRNLNYIKIRCFDHNVNISKSQYMKKTVENYYKYRKNEMHRYDHGILGGYRMFDSLTKNYVINMREESRKTYFVKNNLFYRIEQIPLFAYMADCIVAHNIFFPDESKISTYRDYNLEELINYNRPIKLLDNPLLFMLCLLDSIDPIKYFSKMGSKVVDILKSININFIKDRFELSYIENSVITSEQFLGYINRIDKLGLWLGINTTIDENNHNPKILIDIEK